MAKNNNNYKIIEILEISAKLRFKHYGFKYNGLDSLLNKETYRRESVGDNFIAVDSLEHTYYHLIQIAVENFFDVFDESNSLIKFPAHPHEKSAIISSLLNKKDDFLKCSVPKEQFDYVLSSGRRWVDKNPNSNGIIISQARTYFEDGNINYEEQMYVKNRDNLLSYFQLKRYLFDKFNIKDWEVNFFIKISELIIPLNSDDVDDGGYSYIYKIRNSVEKFNYSKTFYSKDLLEKFAPQDRFFKYSDLLERWQKEFSLKESELLDLLSNHASWIDVQKLEEIEKYGMVIAPLDENVEYFNENSSNKIDFLKNAFFADSYLKKIEEKYLRGLEKRDVAQGVENENKVLYEIKEHWQRVLDSALIKPIKDIQYRLMPLFCKGFQGDDFTNLIIHSAFEYKIDAFSFAALYFSDRFKNIGFFQIFYNDVFKTNEVVWRIEDKEFNCFKEALIYCVAAEVCKKRNLKVNDEIEVYNEIKESEIKKIFKKDTKILNFIEELNKIDFFYIRNSLSGLIFPEENPRLALKEHIKKLYLLLRDSRILFDNNFLEKSGFARFFRAKELDEESCENKIDNGIKAMLSIVILRNYLNNFINENIDKNSKIECFVEVDKVFHKVFAIHESKPDIALHYKHLHLEKIDVNSSNDNQFKQYLWLVKNVEDKIYFPEIQGEVLLSKAFNRFNSYLLRKVKIFDDNLKEYKFIEDARLWVSVDSVLRVFNSNRIEGVKNLSVEVNTRKLSDSCISESKKAGREQKIDYSKIFQTLFEIFQKQELFKKQEDSQSKANYVKEQSKSLSDAIKTLDSEQNQSLKILFKKQKRKEKILGSQVIIKMKNKGINIASKKDGGDINKPELERILKQINSFL